MLTLLVIYGLADDTFAMALIHGEWPVQGGSPPLPLSTPLVLSAKCVFILRNLSSSKRNCVRSNSNDQLEGGERERGESEREGIACRVH